MICKYCGKPVSGGICTSCKKTVSLSYTSHELSDVLGLNAVPSSVSTSQSIGEEQLHAAYEEGYSSGKNQGYSVGWDAAQKDAFKKNKRKQRWLLIIAASTMVLIAVICSFAFNSIGFSRGYQQGKFEGVQEQKNADELIISEKLKQAQKNDDEAIIREKLKSELEDEYKNGYRTGYIKGKAEGYQRGLDEKNHATSSPAPSPTSSPAVLKYNANNSKVKELQRRLIKLGFLAQNEDDAKYGPKTQTAIEEFQKKNGVFPVDGSAVSQDLWDLIMSEDAVPMASPSTPTSETFSERPTPTPENKSEPAESAMKLYIGEMEIPVTWEDNDSVAAMKDLLSLTVSLPTYGDFEQRRQIGENMLGNDSQKITNIGNIILYLGNQNVIIYKPNNWSYIRLGQVDLSEQEMTDLLSNGDVRIKIR